MLLQKWAIPGLFCVNFRLFNPVDNKQIILWYKSLLMNGFEPWTSGIITDCFTNWATTSFDHNWFWPCLVLNFGIVKRVFTFKVFYCQLQKHVFICCIERFLSNGHFILLSMASCENDFGFCRKGKNWIFQFLILFRNFQMLFVEHFFCQKSFWIKFQFEPKRFWDEKSGKCN